MLTTISAKLYLGIDAGGTHTEAVITNETGFVLGRSLLHYGTNPHNTSLDLTYEVLRKAVTAARDDMNYAHPERDSEKYFDLVCVGMTGYDTEGDRRMVTQFVSSLPDDDLIFRQGRVVIVNNGLIGLRSGTEKNYGICLNVGMGSGCYGLAPNGKEAQAGGWGYLLGDQGSGFDIGRAILRQVMREYDGRVPETALSNKVLAQLGLKNHDELVTWVYGGTQIPIPEIAKISSLVNDPDLGDSIELDAIVTKSAVDIVQAYRSVVRVLNLKNQKDMPVVLSGGIFGMDGGRYARCVIRSIKNITPDVHIITPTRSPAEGAISLALAADGTDALPRSALTLVNPVSEHNHKSQ